MGSRKLKAAESIDEAETSNDESGGDARTFRRGSGSYQDLLTKCMGRHSRGKQYQMFTRGEVLSRISG